MDISTIVTTERIVKILHPVTEEPIGVSVSLIAISDPALKKIKRKIHDAKLRLDAKGKHFKAEEVEDNANDLIFTAMTGWEWGKSGEDADGEQATFNGKIPEFNKPSVLAVFEKLPWFQEQVDRAIGDEKAFFST